MNRTLKNNSGIALFLVLWVLAFLSVIVGEFCYAIRTEANITRNFKEQTEAYYIALAGLNIALKTIIRDKIWPEQAKKATEERGHKARWRVNIDIPSVPFENGTFKIRIGNESGKININTANMQLLRMALNTFHLSNSEKDIIVDSILDWRDRDNLHRINGAENSYYRSLSKPYDCKNKDFDSIQELLLVRGVTPNIFYGGLKELFTVYPKNTDHNYRTGRRDKININAASAKMLRTLPNMTDDMVKALMEYREKKDFDSLTEVLSVVGPQVYDSIAMFITQNMNPYYTITSTGMINGSKTSFGIKAVVRIDPHLPSGFRIIEWTDRFLPVQNQEPVCQKEP